MLVAERFGVLPWVLEEEPADRVAYYFNLMGIEGEARTAMHGLDPEEEFYRIE